MANYTPRIIDTELDELLEGLPAISLEGPRAVGKTATALRRARTVHSLDDTEYLANLLGDPSRVVAGKPPILIDEWQRMPRAWDLVRRAVDDDPAGGRFLLTGSAAPTNLPAHSGAGRIVTMRMWPLSLAERGLCPPTVRLADLMSGNRQQIEGESAVGLIEYTREIMHSGFPAIRPLSPRLTRARLDGYIERMVDRDFDDMGHTVRDRRSLTRWLAAFAAATSTTTAYKKIREAATSGEADGPSKPTAIAYRRVLEQTWMIEEVPAWLPARNHLRRLGTAPKHQLADPALAARLLGLRAEALIRGTDTPMAVHRDGTMLGALFESLVTQSVRVYAQANEARVSHFRTRGGEREVDVIVERGDGAIVALETKVKALIDDADVRHLRWLADQIGSDLLDAAVVTTGRYAYRRPDGIGVIPAALLTA